MSVFKWINPPCPLYAKGVFAFIVILNGVKNLGRGVISYLADPPPQTLRFAQGDSEGTFRAKLERIKERGIFQASYIHPLPSLSI